GLLNVGTKTTGVTGVTSEVQHLDISGAKTDTLDLFTLRFGAFVTAPLHFNLVASTLQTALQGLGSLGSNVTAAVASGGGFDITFANSLGNVVQLVARLASPLVNTTTTQTRDAGTSTPEIQHLDVTQVTGGVGYFTLKYKYQETKALRFDVGASALTTALRSAFTLVGTPT